MVRNVVVVEIKISLLKFSFVTVLIKSIRVEVFSKEFHGSLEVRLQI